MTVDAAAAVAAESARQVSFARVLITIVAGFFYVAGWLPGRVWLGVVFAGLMCRQGWRDSQGSGHAPGTETGG